MFTGGYETYEWKTAGLNALPKKEYCAYALSMLGKNIIYGLGSVGLSYYFQSVIFLPAMAISLINIAMQAFSIIKEPIMGVIVDKTSSKTGKSRPYLIIMPSIILSFTVLTYINGIYGKDNPPVVKCRHNRLVSRVVSVMEPGFYNW